MQDGYIIVPIEMLWTSIFITIVSLAIIYVAMLWIRNWYIRKNTVVINRDLFSEIGGQDGNGGCQ